MVPAGTSTIGGLTSTVGGSAGAVCFLATVEFLSLNPPSASWRRNPRSNDADTDFYQDDDKRVLAVFKLKSWKSGEIQITPPV